MTIRPLLPLACMMCLTLLARCLPAAETQPIVETQPIISAAALATQLDEPAVVVVDIRSRDSYVEAHVTGARWVDSETWRSKTFEETGLNDKPYWESALRDAGLKASDKIVVVGESLPEIARAWWLLKYLGLDHVRVLDGGYAAWQKAELPTASGEPSEIESSRIEINFRPQMLAVVDDLLPAALQKEKTCILDNRSTGEFTGSRGIGTRTGHVPGSIHLEWKKFLAEDGTFLPAEQIVALLKQEGISPEEPIVALCQSAGRSSVAALALELAGAKNVKNYYRGWGDYAATLTAPVEKGEVLPQAIGK